VHVVLRAREGVPRLRRRKVFEAVRRAFRVIAARAAFPIVHLSLQHNHLHLLVEADDRQSLSRGMQSFTISLARRINRACGRRGKLFAHRYHATAIRSPRQARNALAYVLNNWRHHREDRGCRAALDRFSSAIAFDGWITSTRFAVPADYTPLPVAAAETWLLTTGWRRRPRISWLEVPADR
jgi:REP element-mobilizing transposase RayT